MIGAIAKALGSASAGRAAVSGTARVAGGTRLVAGTAAKAAAVTRGAVAGAPAASTLERLWTYQARWDLFNRLASAVGSVLPTFTHGISVGVAGGPEADLRRVWYLALSAAFGRYRNRVKSVGGSASIHATWDITGKAATVEIAYTTNSLYQTGKGTIGFIQQKLTDLLGTDKVAPTIGPGGCIVTGTLPAAGKPIINPTNDPCSFLHRGPDQITVGGSWPEFLMPINASVSTPPGGGDAINVPASPSGFGGLITTAAYAQTPTRWSKAIHCGLGSVQYQLLTTINSWGTSTFREWPSFQLISNPKYLPFKVSAAAGPNGQPVIFWVPGTFPTDPKQVPFLPDDGRIITTGEKTDPQVQCPRPPIDGNSRCNLLALVAQNLSTPCFLPETPPCTLTPAGGTGSYVYNPGAALDFDQLDSVIQGTRKFYPLAVGSDLDGYEDAVMIQPNLKE